MSDRIFLVVNTDPWEPYIRPATDVEARLGIAGYGAVINVATASYDAYEQARVVAADFVHEVQDLARASLQKELPL